jgi:signal transduction histidine kinase
MSNNIFLSWLTLKFANPDIEKDYTRTLNKHTNVKNIIYTVIVLIILLILNILFWLRENEEATAFTYIRLTTLSHTVITTALFILTVSSPRQQHMQKIIIYSNYYFLLFLEEGIRYYFVHVQGEINYSLAGSIYLVQNLFSLSFYFNKMLDFMEGGLLTFAKFMSCYLFYTGLFPQFVLNQAIMLIMICVSYFYLYEQRKLYYYCKMVENDSLWYRNIVEKMNSGLISITDKTIKYVNRPLMSIFELIKDDEASDVYGVNNGGKELISKRIDYSSKTGSELTHSVLEGIFKKLKTNIESLGAQPDLGTIKTYLKHHSGDKFLCLGSSSLVDTKINTIHYEIHGRYHTTNQLNEKEDNFDFMLNDVSNVKANEEMNAEFNYKSMFLPKIAHEFKNPILSITELTEQIKESLESLIDNNDDITTEILKKINEILTSIKSMSDFLLILVKDLDYFSVGQNLIRKPTIEKDSVNVRSLLIFLTDITNILIKKYNKENQISFYIKYNTLPKEIYTDEIKLKQILINLLSNAIKFTLHGQIILDLNFINSGKLEIAVMGTGKGFTEEKLKDVFKPYMEQNKELSIIDAGLGLNIVKDLIALFGSKISYEQNSPEGSIFKFDIKIDDVHNYVPNHLDIFEDASSEDFDKTTIEVDYQPTILDRNIFDPEDLALLKADFEDLLTSGNDNKNSLQSNNNQITILVVDDEIMTRKSTIRLIKNYCMSKLINVHILEASDGVECLWRFYQCMIKGEKITLILSDETMMFMDGSRCATIIYELCSLRGFPIIPFYIVTAYESLHFSSNIVIKGVFTKPLSKVNLENALNNLKYL